MAVSPKELKHVYTLDYILGSEDMVEVDELERQADALLREQSRNRNSLPIIKLTIPFRLFKEFESRYTAVGWKPLMCSLGYIQFEPEDTK